MNNKREIQWLLQKCLIIHVVYCFPAWRDDEVVAAASLNYDPAVSAVAQRLQEGKVITKREAEYVSLVFMRLYFVFEANA